MKVRNSALILFYIFTFPLFNGCATNKVVISPGDKAFAANGPVSEGNAAWSMWVKQVLDQRLTGQDDRIIGTLYTRFKKTPLTAYLDRSPALYLHEQLSKYLLRKGYESSAPELATVFITVSLIKFEVSEKPGSVWDELNIRLGYMVIFSDKKEKELGRVLLDAGSTIKTPLNAKTELENAFRQAISDTFESLSDSDEFKSIVKSLQG